MTREEERELGRRIREGDREARNELVVANLRMLPFLVLRYEGLGVPRDDLIQEGALGLMKAAETFDWRKGFRFSTWAKWQVLDKMRRAVQTSDTIYAPPDLYRLRRDVEALLIYEPGLLTVEIAERLKFTAPQVCAALSAARVVRSLDSEVGEDGETTLLDLVADPSTEPEDGTVEDYIDLHRALDELSPDERQAIEKRYLDEGTKHNVNKALHARHDTARALEEQALDKMRRKLAGKEVVAVAEGPRLRADNKSGFVGVSPYRGRWRAQLKRDGRAIALGLWDTPYEANRAIEEFEEQQIEELEAVS